MGKSNTYPFFFFSFFLFLVKPFTSCISKTNRPRCSITYANEFVLVPRSMDFTLALLQKLAREPEQSMEQAVEESYNITLKPWHGWISSAAFKVALKLVPDNKTFTNLLMGKDGSNETLKEETQTLITLLSSFLEEIHSILRVYDLDRLKST